jgi:hypothetical protein
MRRQRKQLRIPYSAFRTLVAVIAAIPSPGLAQQANIQTPLRTANDNFFEQIGTSWALRGPGWFFRFGGGPAVPPFGGAQPGAGLAGGAGVAGGGVSGGLGLMAAQGSQRSNVMQAGNLTLFNGYPGFVSDTSLSPFVTGIIPVVGQGKPLWRQQLDGDIPTQKRDPAPAPEVIPQENKPVAAPFKAPAAEPGLLSLEELSRQRAAADDARRQEAQQHLAKAREARAAGKASVARIYYQMAVRRAEGELKGRVEAELKTLDTGRRAP